MDYVQGSGKGIEGWLFARKGLEREGTATTVH